MKNKIFHIITGCCAVFFCATSVNAQRNSWSHWGENNTFSTGTNQLLIGVLAGTPSIGDITNNFWTGGLTPATTSPLYISSGITYTVGAGPCPTTPINGDWFCFETAWSGSISCDGGFTIIEPKGSQPLAVHYPQDAYDTCAHLKEWEYMSLSPEDSGLAKQAYDTLRLYVEKCAASDQTSYQAFGHLDGAVELNSPNDTSRFRAYRDWLISVIYLNTTEPAYFCNCLSSIAGTYQYSQFTIRAGLAILNYIRHISACYGKGLDKEFTKDSLMAIQDGYDPTNLPPLDSLGLGFLLKGGVKSSPSSAIPSQYLASFSSNPNPFTSATKLNFALNRMTYVTIEVYDLLGNKIFGNSGRSYEAGSYEINLDATNFPSGTLYARISTGFGEVKTVKLVHEK
jgi:hypothetical protein